MTKAKKIFISVAVVTAVFGAAAGYWATWTGSSKEIEAVANQFKAESSWELKTNSVTPPSNLCLEGRCPEVIKKWVMNKTLTEDEFLRIIDESDWNEVKLENPDCFNNFENTEDNLSCYASGNVKNYLVQIYIKNQDKIHKQPSLIFYITD